MNAYEQMTLGDLIEALNALGDAKVRGLGGDIHSDRGFYERNAVAPTMTEHAARDLAATYQKQVGKEIHGWKGGEYYVKERENVYVAEYGDTGPAVCGLIPGADGVYEPLLVRVSSW